MAWKRVCSVNDVAVDGLRLFEVDGVSLLLVNLGTEYRAIPPACPHMEEPLAQSGICANGILTCSKHLWQWDLATGAKQGPAEKELLMYQVRVEGDDVMVHLDKELAYEYEEEDDDDFEW